MQAAVLQRNDLGRPQQGCGIGSDGLGAGHVEGAGGEDVEPDGSGSAQGAEAPGAGQRRVDAGGQRRFEVVEIFDRLVGIRRPGVHHRRHRGFRLQERGEHRGQTVVVAGVNLIAVVGFGELSSGANHDQLPVDSQRRDQLVAAGADGSQDHRRPLDRGRVGHRLPPPRWGVEPAVERLTAGDPLGVLGRWTEARQGQHVTVRGKPGFLPLERVARQRYPLLAGLTVDRVPVDGDACGPQPTHRFQQHDLIVAILARVAHGRGGDNRGRQFAVSRGEGAQGPAGSELQEGHRAGLGRRNQTLAEPDGVSNLACPERRVGCLGVGDGPAGDIGDQWDGWRRKCHPGHHVGELFGGPVHHGRVERMRGVQDLGRNPGLFKLGGQALDDLGRAGGHRELGGVVGGQLGAGR